MFVLHSIAETSSPGETEPSKTQSVAEEPEESEPDEPEVSEEPEESEEESKASSSKASSSKVTSSKATSYYSNSKNNNYDEDDEKVNVPRTSSVAGITQNPNGGAVVSGSSSEESSSEAFNVGGGMVDLQSLLMKLIFIPILLMLGSIYLLISVNYKAHKEKKAAMMEEERPVRGSKSPTKEGVNLSNRRKPPRNESRDRYL